MEIIKAVVTINVDDEELKEEGFTTEDVMEDIFVVEDNIVDGVVIQRRGDLGDETEHFYLSAPTIESIEVVGSEDNE